MGMWGALLHEIGALLHEINALLHEIGVKGRIHRRFLLDWGWWVLMSAGLVVWLMLIQQVQIAWVQVPLRVGLTIIKQW